MAAGSRVWVMIAVALVAGGLGFGLGFELRGSPTSPTLSIVGAGTLSPLFPQAAQALVNETPGVSAPTAAQLYEGSIAALNVIAQLHQTYDVAAAADFRLIPRILEPTYAGYEVVFATTPEVLAYDPTVTAFAGINSTNWATKLMSPGVVLGVANASLDPNGYNGIFSLELQGLLSNGDSNSVYGHFYSNPPGSYAVPNPATAKEEAEAQAATLISQHVVNAFIIYQSYAISHHVSYVSFSPLVGLGNLSMSAIAYYAQASTTITTETGSKEIVRGAPVAFAVTAPSNGPNPMLGVAFINLLFSPEGRALITTNGFVAVFPGWADKLAQVPPVLAPEVAAMPSALTALLP